MNNFVVLIDHFISLQDTYQLNFVLLFAVVALLLVALCICIYITKKNHLYSKPKKKEEQINVTITNEVA